VLASFSFQVICNITMSDNLHPSDHAALMSYGTSMIATLAASASCNVRMRRFTN
jgi:cell division protein FtsW (lipid II flippase)